MPTTTQHPPAIEHLVAAIEADDAAAQAALYAEDVVVEVLNRDRPPADPLVLRGRAAVRALLDDVAGRGLTHRVVRASGHAAVGAVHVACTYPTGEQVTCMSSFDLHDGLIVRETRVEVWDG